MLIRDNHEIDSIFKSLSLFTFIRHIVFGREVLTWYTALEREQCWESRLYSRQSPKSSFLVSFFDPGAP